MRTFAKIDSEPTPERTRHEFVYDLRIDGANSQPFYAEVAAFSERVVAEIDRRACAALDGYTRYVTGILREPPRSRAEYGLELLTVGMTIRMYGELAAATPGWVIGLTRELCAGARHA